MKLHDLKPTPGSHTPQTRVGRGVAGGKGKTAGRGTKGAGARGRSGMRAYFEGGQLPLVRRLPFKRGFKNLFRIEYQEVNLSVLNDRFEAGAEVTPEALVEKGIIREANKPIVLLGRGDIEKALTVHAHRVSKSASEKIEKAGGKIVAHEVTLTGAHATIKKLRKEDIAAGRKLK
jgi:large subunit ribosomal protein L15